MPVLLCDLDDTLFDHLQATRTALARLQAIEPRLQAWPIDALEARHHEVLEAFHREVLAGRLSIDEARQRRFAALVEAPPESALAATLAQTYRDAYTQDWREVEGAAALLAAVRALGWQTVILTNNLVSEQRLKLARIGLTPLVDELVTSEEVGLAKPHPGIFEHALSRVQAAPDEAVMLGDAWQADVEGARGAGIRPVWFNRRGAPTPDPSVAEVRALTPVQAVVDTLAGGVRHGLHTHHVERR